MERDEGWCLRMPGLDGNEIRIVTCMRMMDGLNGL